MTVSEIFSEIISHQIKGLMIHQQLADYYDFLGLNGYKRCHEYHYFAENIAFRKTSRYYLNHYNALVPEKPVENPNVIPQSWYKYTRHDVDISAKRTAVKSGLQMWRDWESETKKLYERMYKELMDIDEISAAIFLKGCIEDVDCELKMVDRYWLDKKAIDYDMAVIIPEQHEKHEEYKRKMECLKFDYEHK